MAGWRDHYEYIKRLQGHLTAKSAPGETRAAYNQRMEDSLRGFFVAAFHLKDWLKNDPKSGLNRGEVEAVVNNSTWLGLAADVANGVKHLTLKHYRVDPAPSVFADTAFSNLPIAGPSSQPIASIGIEGTFCEIRTTTTAHDAIVVANECVKAWETFLNSKGLL